MKENLPGAFPESYMTTESRFGVDYTPITVNGKYCGVLRGLWKMVGDMMGGPFVSHVRLDEKNNRVVVAEGFVFAPETDKRNFIRRIEAALYTLRLDIHPVNTGIFCLGNDVHIHRRQFQRFPVISCDF